MTTIFSKIIAGEVENYKIYEDDMTFVFLTLRPHAKGHMLIVPKIEVDHWDDVPEDYYRAMWDTARKMAKLLKEKFNPKRVGVMIQGFEIPHAHIHIVPINDVHDLDTSKTQDATPEELADAQRILTS
jgi:histidine triad (HIT) family protein